MRRLGLVLAVQEYQEVGVDGQAQTLRGEGGFGVLEPPPAELGRGRGREGPDRAHPLLLDAQSDGPGRSRDTGGVEAQPARDELSRIREPPTPIRMKAGRRPMTSRVRTRRRRSLAPTTPRRESRKARTRLRTSTKRTTRSRVRLTTERPNRSAEAAKSVRDVRAFLGHPQEADGRNRQHHEQHRREGQVVLERRSLHHGASL